MATHLDASTRQNLFIALQRVSSGYTSMRLQCENLFRFIQSCECDNAKIYNKENKAKNTVSL